MDSQSPGENAPTKVLIIGAGTSAGALRELLQSHGYSAEINDSASTGDGERLLPALYMAEVVHRPPVKLHQGYPIALAKRRRRCKGGFKQW